MKHRDEWASEGELNVVGEPEQILRYQKSAYGGLLSSADRHCVQNTR